ncbi:MAG: TetR/AcrR family transcriptional regulator [Myxococcota bacterium]|nr:TetR/AcrR family transcriptional regulator [Myxococcota bacterium]
MTPRPGEPRPGPGRRELQRLATERLIRATALELFVAQGFEATTTKQIADEAGVAHGTVFLVAATKEALLVRVLEERLRAIVVARTRSLPKRRIEVQLRHVFDGLFDFYASEPQLSRGFLRAIMFFAEPVAKAQYDEHVARFSTYLASLFEAAKGRGEIAARTESDAAAASVLALYVYAVISFLNEAQPDRRALGDRFRAGVASLFRGLRPVARPTRASTRRRRSP